MPDRRRSARHRGNSSECRQFPSLPTVDSHAPLDARRDRRRRAAHALPPYKLRGRSAMMLVPISG